MIIDGLQPGDAHADEHEVSLDEVSWCVQDLRDRTGPDFHALCSTGDTVAEGIEAVRDGLKAHLLATGEFTEIEWLRFTQAERRHIEQTRLQAFQADEVSPRSGAATFPGE